jgi:hypothetical protein
MVIGKNLILIVWFQSVSKFKIMYHLFTDVPFVFNLKKDNDFIGFQYNSGCLTIARI